MTVEHDDNLIALLGSRDDVVDRFTDVVVGWPFSRIVGPAHQTCHIGGRETKSTNEDLFPDRNVVGRSPKAIKFGQLVFSAADQKREVFRTSCRFVVRRQYVALEPR